MNILYKIYGWLMDRPGVAIRWVAVNALVFVLMGGGISALLEYYQGFFDESLQAWIAFIIGFTSVALFNIGLQLIGLGYADWKQTQRSRPS
jgi:hypothetical protein